MTSTESVPPGDLFRSLGEQISSFATNFEALNVPAHAVDTAEGQRLFLRYFTIGLDQWVEYPDPAYPAFHQKTRDGVRKFAGDSPGQLYDSVVLSAEHTYEVSGTMAETALIEFGVYSGDLSGQNQTRRRLVDALTEEELQIGADGSFTVRLEPTGQGERPPNTLWLDPDTGSMAVRRYLRDPRVDRPRPLKIVRTSEAPPPPALSPQRLAAGVQKAAAFAGHNVEVWSRWADQIKATKRNVLVGFDDDGQMFTPKGHSYLDGYWQVADDEVLTIAFRPPAGAYWSFVPMNYWMESLEWRFGDPVWASSFDTSPGEDGVVRLALAERDPRLPGHRWLATQGHREGMMAFRLARHTGPMPQASTEVLRNERRPSR